ncbi:MAG: retention module-containing protein, partial [Smithella sp.]
MAEIKKTATSEMSHQVTGKVAILYGTVKAISPDGTVRLLKLSSPVYADDRIITGDDGSISIVFNTFPPTQLDLGRVSEVVVDEDVYGAVTPDVSAEASAEQKAIQDALLAGDQPIEVDATAAGAEASSGGGHPTFVVNADWSAVIPESGAETTGINLGTPETELTYTALNPENSVPTITVDTGEGGGDDGGSGDGTGNNGSNVIGSNDIVYEAGLPGGSDSGATTTADGTFIISDPDGLDDIASITINGTTIPINDVVGTEISGTYGTLTITGYDSSTGEGTYTYELTSPTIDGPGTETDIFNISTTDQSGATSDPAAITIEITDDLPNAVDDGQTIMEDATAAITGNVFDNDVHPNGERGADAPVVFDEWTGDTTAQYGTFTANPDGSYSYTLDPDNGIVQGLNEGETLTETFTYQIKDADGDIDTATLTITIVGTNETPVINIDPGNGGADDVVYESGLPNGSDAAADTEYATGTFTVSDPDGLGDIQSVTINGTTIAISNLAGSVINGVNGILTVTDYNSATGVANYTYQLTSPTTDGPGIETEVFTMSVSDESGTSDPAVLTIEIADDVPNAVDDSLMIGENDFTVHSGNVFANDVHPNGQPGADTPVTFNGWTNTTTNYGEFIDTGNGNYTYQLDMNNESVKTLSASDTLTETLTYQVIDADGDIDTATLTITIAGANDAPVAVDDTLTATEDTALTITAADLFAADGTGSEDDYDIDSASFSSITINGLPAQGTLLLNGSAVTVGQEISVTDIEAGNLTYMPAANSTETVTFNYTVSDGSLSSNEATVTISFTPEDDTFT